MLYLLATLEVFKVMCCWCVCYPMQLLTVHPWTNPVME